MRFIVDESTGRKLARLIKQAGYDVAFSLDILGRVDDDKLLEFCEREKCVLITDDRDFGELIFRLKRPVSGVILFRMTKNPEKRFEMIKDILDKAEGKFIVVREWRIKIREL